MRNMKRPTVKSLMANVWSTHLLPSIIPPGSSPILLLVIFYSPLSLSHEPFKVCLTLSRLSDLQKTGATRNPAELLDALSEQSLRDVMQLRRLDA